MPSDLSPDVGPPAAPAAAEGAAAVTYAGAPFELDAPRPEAVQEAQTTQMGPILGASLEAVRVSAWFGNHKVLEQVDLSMSPGIVTALIGPSGCGKSTFLRILNRMHETIPSAKLAGEVLLDGRDIYAPGTRVTDARSRIGISRFHQRVGPSHQEIDCRAVRLQEMNKDLFLDRLRLFAGLRFR